MADPREILERSKTVAVVGMSTNPNKAAFGIPAGLQAAGYRIIPVNPYADEILGEKAYPTLYDVPEELDLVNVFRPSEQATEVVRRAIQVRAKAIWLQQGIVSAEGRQMAEDAAIPYIEDT